MKKLLIACLVALPLMAVAQGNPDESFYKNAAEVAHSQVEAGKAAEAKATNPAVKKFAAMMVKDHIAANERLQRIAASKGIDLPAGAGMMQKVMSQKTDMKPGDSFDKDYIQSQIKAHRDTAELLQKEIAEGRDPQAKAFASAVLPKVRAHLEKIIQIAANVGVR